MPLKDSWLNKVYKQSRSNKAITDRADKLRKDLRKEKREMWKRNREYRFKNLAPFLEGEEREYFRGKTIQYQQQINNYKDLARVLIEEEQANMFGQAAAAELAAEVAEEQAAAEAAIEEAARRRPQIVAQQRRQHIAQLITADWSVGDALTMASPPPGISRRVWEQGDHPQFAAEEAVWRRLARMGNVGRLASGAAGYFPMLRKLKKNKSKKNKSKKNKSKKSHKRHRTLRRN